MKELFNNCFLVYNSNERRFELYDKRDNEDEYHSWDKLIMSFPLNCIDDIIMTEYKNEIEEKSDYELLINNSGKLVDYRD